MKKQILIYILIYSLICSVFIISINSCGNSESAPSIIDIPVGLSTFELENGYKIQIDTPTPLTLELIDDTSNYPSGSKLQLVRLEGNLSSGQTIIITYISDTFFTLKDSIAFINANGQWELENCELSVNKKTIMVTVEHLSIWGVVESSELLEIQVTPTSERIARGTNCQYIATGIYNNGKSNDLLSTVTWISENVTIATVSNEKGTKGIATGVNLGTTYIYAVNGSIESNHVQLEVTDAELTDLQVTPTDETIAQGNNLQYTAIGIFTDESNQVLTQDPEITWYSTNESIATISNSKDTRGLSIGEAIGDTLIYATFGSVTSNYAQLQVTDAELQEIQVTPTTTPIALGTLINYSAIGIYSDGSNIDLTHDPNLTWHSSNPFATIIVTTGPQKGRATSEGVGNTSIYATLGLITSNYAELQVTEAELEYIEVTPTNNPSIPEGETYQFTATGIYTDGGNHKITKSVTWYSKDTDVASVSNACGSKGLVTGENVGGTKIYAKLDGIKSNHAPITVTEFLGPKWGTAELIETGYGSAYPPQVGVDGSGNAVAVWYQWEDSLYNIWSNRYVAGSGWGTAERIETDDSGDAEWPQVGIDGSGNAIAVWQQYDSTRNNIWANRYVVGTGWGTAQLIETDSGNALRPQVGIDGNGNAIAVWYQWDGSMYSIWANHYVAGTGWGAAQLIETNNSGDAYQQQVNVNGSGNAVVVWRQRDGTRYDIYSNHYVSGVGWGTAQLIETDNSGDAGFPQVGIDGSGNAIAVWHQYDGARNDIWSNRFVVGIGWGTAQIIETDSGNALHPQVGVDGNGNAIVVWGQDDGTGTRYNVWSNRYVVGTGWGTAQIIQTGSDNSAPPHLSVNGSGNAVAVWSQDDGTWYNMWANRYVVGTGWGTAELIETNNGSAGSEGVGINASGNAVVVWRQWDGTRFNIWSNSWR